MGHGTHGCHGTHVWGVARMYVSLRVCNASVMCKQCMYAQMSIVAICTYTMSCMYEHMSMVGTRMYVHVSMVGMCTCTIWIVNNWLMCGRKRCMCTQCMGRVYIHVCTHTCVLCLHSCVHTYVWVVFTFMCVHACTGRVCVHEGTHVNGVVFAFMHAHRSTGHTSTCVHMSNAYVDIYTCMTANFYWQECLIKRCIQPMRYTHIDTYSWRSTHTRRYV